MNSLYNHALKQVNALQRDLEKFQTGEDTSVALQGNSIYPFLPASPIPFLFIFQTISLLSAGKSLSKTRRTGTPTDKLIALAKKKKGETVTSMHTRQTRPTLFWK
jgi:hypothetical protein